MNDQTTKSNKSNDFSSLSSSRHRDPAAAGAGGSRSKLRSKKSIATPSVQDIQRTYERWWLGKKIKERKIVKVEYFGNKVYGAVTLHFEDGKEETVFTNSFRPRKYDLILDKE
jgi:hypothetical protein